MRSHDVSFNPDTEAAFLEFRLGDYVRTEIAMTTNKAIFMLMLFNKLLRYGEYTVGGA